MISPENQKKINEAAARYDRISYQFQNAFAHGATFGYSLCSEDNRSKEIEAFVHFNHEMQTRDSEISRLHKILKEKDAEIARMYRITERQVSHIAGYKIELDRIESELRVAEEALEKYSKMPKLNMLESAYVAKGSPFGEADYGAIGREALQSIRSIREGKV